MQAIQSFAYGFPTHDFLFDINAYTGMETAKLLTANENRGC